MQLLHLHQWEVRNKVLGHPVCITWALLCIWIYFEREFGDEFEVTLKPTIIAPSPINVMVTSLEIYGSR